MGLVAHSKTLFFHQGQFVPSDIKVESSYRILMGSKMILLNIT